MIQILLAIVLSLAVVTANASPLIIAHRGASGYLPEHTLEAATLAHAQGADFIEQDLVMTRDNVLVVLHDIHLERVTNVEQVFPDRHRDDGRYYVIDFTLAEIRMLGVHERAQRDGTQVFPGRYRGETRFRVATFGEQIELINNLNRQFDRQVGLYPELKDPSFHRREGKDISRAALEVLRANGLDHPGARVFLQCFDFAETKRLRQELNARLPLIQLIANPEDEDSIFDYLQTEAGINEIRSVANGVGPSMSLLLDQTGTATPFANRLRDAGLEIHPYTHRSDALPPSVDEAMLLNALRDEAGITGIFTDFPDRVRALFEQSPASRP